MFFHILHDSLPSFFEVATLFLFGVSGTIIYTYSSLIFSVVFFFKLFVHMSIINGGKRKI
jgi:hypothetical protein